nr:hypothetical protein [Sulfurimonas sp. MAG313]
MAKILSEYPLEERTYRFRCVEGWSMVVPWIGFELSYLLKKAVSYHKVLHLTASRDSSPHQF